ncbi:Piso0_004816 [Millerozyma farinosa CBS 7064]|uniref:Small ribosomal subunit protein uS7m n=1 Tax=Pichia sorbitophila (strain ATCC MYA-4447 / BCRC 22081 / CBS 7064 / NBRC 10061 / NRRL Y-12695) TaxID=559304 RepID=G8Y3G6_PICSO|nr:Piso0_004816 [Millerozyma farinosa CBS 7064]
MVELSKDFFKIQVFVVSTASGLKLQMSIVKAALKGLRSPVQSKGKYAVSFVNTVRLNSNSHNSNTNKPGLFPQIYPVNKDKIEESDIDEWLKAVKELRGGKAVAETEYEVYLTELANPEQFQQDEFVPSEEQKAQSEKYANKRVPVQNNTTVETVVNLIMRDGKKYKAQKIVYRALYIVHLRTRKDPVEILEETLSKLGPLMTTKVEKTGVAKNRVVPVPLNRRQRNRYAIMWILDGAEKKKSSDFSVRLAEEIVGAYEGKSSGYDKRAQMHKAAMAQRAYIRL